MAPSEVMRRWAEGWAKEGLALDWEKLIPRLRASGVAEEVGSSRAPY
jgi:hypothetical protein